MDDYLDKLSAGLPQQELDEIEKLFKQGLQHETEFNLAQQIDGHEVVVPLWKELTGFNFPLLSDFDLCCSKSSSDLKSLAAYEQLISNELLKVPSPGKQKLTPSS